MKKIETDKVNLKRWILEKTWAEDKKNNYITRFGFFSINGRIFLYGISLGRIVIGL